MRNKKRIIALRLVVVVSLLLHSLFSYSQGKTLALGNAIDTMVVEKYYVSDAKDAADSSGGKLDSGSVTYRVYIDLKPGVQLVKVYGDTAHPLKIVSTETFFNYKEDGGTLGVDINKNLLKNKLVALDSWITMSSVTSTAGMVGVLKTDDTDGSFIATTGRVLSNTDSSMGKPLSKADGLLATTQTIPRVFYGSMGYDTNRFKLLPIDSTIFDSIVSGKEYISKNSYWGSAGTLGPTADNRILIAQLTTKGKLSLELNIEVLEPNGTSNETNKYVVSENVHTFTDGGSQRTEIYAPVLHYPPIAPVCGCTDSRYLEYNKKAKVNVADSCKTRKVFGCTDPWACNYDPRANVLFLCCYPGFCDGRDIREVCPKYSTDPLFFVYPNPAHDVVSLQVYPTKDKAVKYTIVNSSGSILFTKDLGTISETIVEEVNISHYETGVYVVNMMIGSTMETKKFTKK